VSLFTPICTTDTAFFSFSLIFHAINIRYGATNEITNWNEKSKRNRPELEKSIKEARVRLDCSDIEEEEEEEIMIMIMMMMMMIPPTS